VSFINNKLSKEALETIFTNLATPAASRTLTITNNWGAPTTAPGAVLSLTGTLTAGSKTISSIVTTNLAVGMQITGTNTSITTGRAVTFSDAGDTVNLTAHGLSNGDEVSFTAPITNTTGISANTIYYVVNATTDNFQVATSDGGTALALTNNGSGRVRYNATIETIGPGNNVTMSRPMADSGTVTSGLNFRVLKTYRALLRNFAVNIS